MFQGRTGWLQGCRQIVASAWSSEGKMERWQQSALPRERRRGEVRGLVIIAVLEDLTAARTQRLEVHPAVEQEDSYSQTLKEESSAFRNGSIHDDAGADIAEPSKSHK